MWEHPYQCTLVQNDRLAREPHWTESLAVGSLAFTEKCSQLYNRRWKIEFSKAENATPDTWIIKEPQSPYGSVSPPENSR